MKKAVVLCHGNLGEGLVSAMHQIVGIQQEIYLLSNQDKSAAELYDTIRELLAEFKRDEPFVLFTDLDGGSCTTACRKVLNDYHNAYVVAGVNLTILIEFVFYRDRPIEQLISVLLEKGKKSIRAYGFTPVQT